MKYLLMTPLLPMMLGGCMAPETSATETLPPTAPSGECDATSSQSLVGQKATKELGAQVLKNSGARIFRWLAPGTVVTMEYNGVRVNVAYDEQMIVTSINCG